MSDEAAVFMHGSPGCAAEFEPLLRAVGEEMRAVTIDLPDFGAAAKPSPREFIYDVPNIGLHLASITRELGLERVHFVLALPPRVESPGCTDRG